MASTPDYPVYIGFWTNWSDGKIMGAVLTLGRSDANLLIAFVAFFLTVITTRLWAIISFSFHAALSTPKPRDTLHHQRQVLLRNNGGPVDTAWTLVLLAWQWRKNASIIKRILPLLTSTLLLAVGFSAAAGFSSRIGRGSEVLLVPQNCGIYKPAGQRTPNDKLISWSSRMQTQAANYAQECYSNTLASGSTCINAHYVQQQLPMSIQTNATCPFDPEVCATSTSNLILDTGMIDSHIHLGINAPPDQRVQYRTVLHCAPLITEGFSEIFNYYSTNQSFTRYYYGHTSPTNFTYEYPSSAYARDMSANGDGDSDWLFYDYKLRVFPALPSNGSFTSPEAQGTFVPVSALQNGDNDVYLIFLSPNQVMFRQPTADLWYNSSQTALAETLQVFTNNGESDITLWYPVEPASPLACLGQEQWCFPGRGCTQLTGYVDQEDLRRALSGDNATYQRAQWIADVMDSVGPTINDILNTLGGKALTSRFGLTSGLQGAIADTQWQQDVAYWQTITLAVLQQSLVTTATGDFPDDPTGIRSPDSEEARVLCASQKIISQAHVSFSVFGLAFILVVGLLIIITSFILEPLARFIQRRSNSNPYARVEWYATSIFQLQRLAQEELGIGNWDNCDGSIPTTAPDKVLAALDISDERHPFLLAPEKHNPSEEPSTSTKMDEASTLTILATRPLPSENLGGPHNIYTPGRISGDSLIKSESISQASGDLQPLATPDSPDGSIPFSRSDSVSVNLSKAETLAVNMVPDGGPVKDAHCKGTSNTIPEDSQGTSEIDHIATAKG